MKLLILLCANLLSALDTTHALQQSLPSCEGSKLYAFTDSNTPFTIEYMNNEGTLKSSTASFALHLRNLTNQSHTTGSAYWDYRSHRALFNVYLLKEKKFIRLENKMIENSDKRINTFPYLKDFLQNVEKNEVSIWNVNESILPTSKFDKDKKSYQISIWYAVIGSNELKLMQTQLHNQQTSECIDGFVRFLD